MKRNKTEKIQGFVLLSLGVGPWQEHSVGMEAKDETETCHGAVLRQAFLAQSRNILTVTVKHGYANYDAPEG